MTTDRDAGSYSGQMMAPTQDAGTDESKQPKTAVEKLHQAAKLLNHRQRLVLLLSTTFRIIVGLCDLAIAASMYLLFLLLQERHPQHAFWWIPRSLVVTALLAALLVAFRALADIASTRFVFRQIQSLYTGFLLQLTQGYCQMRWSKFVERNRGELSNHAIHTAREAADFYHRSVELIAGIIIVAVLVTALFYQSTIAALAFLGALAAYYGIHRMVTSGRIEHAAARREQSLRNLHRIVMGTLSAGREIRTYGSYAQFGSEIEQHAQQLANSNRQALFLPDLMRVIADQGLILIFLSAIVSVELWHGDTHRLLSLLAFYFVLSRRLLPLIGQLSLIAGQMQNSYESVRIVAIELAECERHSAPAYPADPPPPGTVLELSHVSFGFDAQRLILHDINLNLHPREIAVLYGASGIGKSSLIDLIAGVAQPLSGSVRINRNSIGYLPQDVPLLDDSVRANLQFGLPPIHDELLIQALKVARLDEFVNELPKGLDTAIGDNGAQLSGGERQRLGLARAILRKGSLLLLDEATSALDERKEREILENLRALECTVLLATHRNTSHIFADRILRIEKGRLVEGNSAAPRTPEIKMTAGAIN